MGDDRKLSEKLEYFKLDRPSEWMMAEYIRDAKKLETKLGSLPGQLDRIEEKLDQLLAKKKPAKPRASKKVEYHPAFENIYVDYPKVAGANKVECYAQYNQRLSENKGSVNDFICDLHASVIQYGDFCKETGRWLMSPQAFMGHKKHYENDWTIPTAPDNVPRENSELVSWAKDKGYRGAYPNESFADYRKALEVLHRQGE